MTKDETQRRVHEARLTMQCLLVDTLTAKCSSRMARAFDQPERLRDESQGRPVDRRRGCELTWRARDSGDPKCVGCSGIDVPL